VPDNWTAVGAAISNRMDEIGMQQKDLAAISNVSPATIREILRGKKRRRNPRILRDISVALRWPANHLAGRLQDEQPNQRSGEADRTEAEAWVGDPSAFLAKLASVLERRVGHVVDVIYNNDADVDITIEIRHSSVSPPEERG
jgi:transcriptional regulator with XRE-family HTH domain